MAAGLVADVGDGAVWLTLDEGLGGAPDETPEDDGVEEGADDGSPGVQPTSASTPATARSGALLRAAACRRPSG